MLRLGHIDYSNCFPVHALLLDRGVPAGIELRRGVPTALNAALAAGEIDVAPCSSIEYARHADRYRLLPGLAIGSAGPVGSILLELDSTVDALDEREVALPTASATAVVLLRGLLERRFDVHPRYRRFDQTADPDPLGAGAHGALWIGDVALRRNHASRRPCLDLGAAWTEWTGLPFVYAAWQVSAGADKAREIGALHGLLLESKAYFEQNVETLAARHAPDYGIGPDLLERYWRSLEYELDARLQEGLLRFYELAAELGEIPAVPELRWA